ncbi:MAG TPA: hypothetical protein VIY28_05840 [Pseudonocardiaceae bacterium]
MQLAPVTAHRLVEVRIVQRRGIDVGPGGAQATGAVVTGKRTGELADYWGGDHHDGVPIFVPTRRAPEGEPPRRRTDRCRPDAAVV